MDLAASSNLFLNFKIKSSQIKEIESNLKTQGKYEIKKGVLWDDGTEFQLVN